MKEKIRVLFVASYRHPAYHRKVERLADAPDVEIIHINSFNCDREAGRYPSANGEQWYTIRQLPHRSLGEFGDPHRTVLWTQLTDLQLRSFRPHIIHCEFEQESLGAAQIALMRWVTVPRTPLILYSYQNILRQRKFWVRALSRLTLIAAQHILCASQEAVSVLHQQGYTKGTTIMPSVGVDERYFYPKAVPELRQNLQLEGPVIGYVGRLVPEKGLSTLLEAAAQVEPAVSVLLVGEGPEQSRLAKRAEQLGIASRIRFVGTIPYDAIADYMNLCDIFVLPSLTRPHWKEQFGRVLAEAMACQVAVIGSDSGAIPEVVGSAGRIFPEGDSPALARQITELIRQPELCQTLARQGYKRAMEKYKVDPIAADILAVWRELYQQRF